MRLTTGLLVLALVLSGCGDDDGDDDGRGLGELTTPTFAPDPDGDSGSASASTTAAAAAPVNPPTDGASTVAPDAVAPGPSSTSTPPAASPPPQERVSVDDPDDDAVGGLDDDPPAWSDLAGVTLIRQGNAYGLRVTLAGGSAPTEARGEETMNIASFYDVDGDGGVDYEVWANLGPDGWGGSWFDSDGRAAFGEDSNVSIEVDGAEVVVLFPDVMLDVPDTFRFSVASEYGELGVLTSAFARRDDVPDDDRAVAFPG